MEEKTRVNSCGSCCLQSGFGFTPETRTRNWLRTLSQPDITVELTKRLRTKWKSLPSSRDRCLGANTSYDKKGRRGWKNWQRIKERGRVENEKSNCNLVAEVTNVPSEMDKLWKDLSFLSFQLLWRPVVYRVSVQASTWNLNMLLKWVRKGEPGG